MGKKNLRTKDFFKLNLRKGDMSVGALISKDIIEDDEMLKEVFIILKDNWEQVYKKAHKAKRVYNKKVKKSIK